MATMANTAHSPALDPEEEAFRALKNTICSICRKQGVTSKDDRNLQKMVNRYKDRYPSLTPQLIQDELEATNYASPIPASLDIDDKHSMDASALTRNTAPWASASGLESAPPANVDGDYNDNGCMTLEFFLPSHDGEEAKAEESTSDENEPSTKEATSYCCPTFKKICKENNGYNPLTYTFLLSIFVILMFLTSVLFTYMNYNHGPYRDWALAGGVTSTSAEFRVRGPASDDGNRREFVVSTSSNLAIERFQILNTPVSFADFTTEEHFVKRLSLDTLKPLTAYYYGITRPQRASNSAVVAGDVGNFATPASEGTRMDFTIATGSCALTGSKSSMFASILDLDPLLFIHMGDLHYEDLNTLDIDERLEAYDKVMGSPSQRLLYMRTIFSYIWDDHDWLGNNQDSEDDEAARIAKETYTLGIPHYGLGSTSTNEADAAKYQAYTIGTVRFIITDLRSESVRSSEYYSGKVYSKEQKEWLFNEFSQAENYDFVVWVTTRPWTDPVKLGSDSWGGFVPDRDELAAHIAATIGAGPRNLLVLSGDNHMVAFDDGSSTDYSGQDDNPGGFPLLHSGPMTNYGSGVMDFFKPNTNHFTDGCMAFNSELNYQFSTVDFYFPTDDDWSEQACIRIKSYSKDTSNVIFEKEMCGELMKNGTPEQDTCTLKKLSVPTYSLFIAAAALIVLSGVLSLWFLGLDRCHIALSYFGIGILFYLLTIGAAIAGAFCFGSLGVNMFSVSAFVLSQSILGALFVGNAIFRHCTSHDTDKELMKSSKGDGDVEAGVKSIEKDNKTDMNAMEEDGASTHDDTFDDALTHPVMGRAGVVDCDAKENTDNSATSEMGKISMVKSKSKENTDNSTRSDIREASIDKNDSKESTCNSAPSAMGDTAIDKSYSKESTDSSAAMELGVAAMVKGGVMENTAAPKIGEETIEEPVATVKRHSKKSTDSAIPPKMGEKRDNDVYSVYTADSSVAAVLCGEYGSSSPLEEKVAYVLPFPAVPDSVAAVLSGKAFSGRIKYLRGVMSPSAVRNSWAYRDTEERVDSVVSGNAFFPDRQAPPKADDEEGIEVTNPTNRGTDIKVSPNLVEL